MKYETRAGHRQVLDANPILGERLRDPEEPLIVTEGARKADAAISEGYVAVALLGVWCWRKDGVHCPSGRTSSSTAARCMSPSIPTSRATRTFAKPRWVMRIPSFEGAPMPRVSTYLPVLDGGKQGLDDYRGAGWSTSKNLLGKPPLTQGLSPSTRTIPFWLRRPCREWQVPAFGL